MIKNKLNAYMDYARDKDETEQMRIARRSIACDVLKWLFVTEHNEHDVERAECEF